MCNHQVLEALVRQQLCGCKQQASVVHRHASLWGGWAMCNHQALIRQQLCGVQAVAAGNRWCIATRVCGEGWHTRQDALSQEGPAPAAELDLTRGHNCAYSCPATLRSIRMQL